MLLSQTTRDLLDSALELREFGAHRLKDLAEPQRLYQLGYGEFPPLKSLNQTNLPVQPTPLIGRERELREVAELVKQHRLVTLTGPGGSGKTRLALQAAVELVDRFRDGVWFVSLAALRDPQGVEPAIAQTLGVREPQTLGGYLATKQTLLLLDNFEQVVDAAPMLAQVLGEAPDVVLLVTSRACLRLAAEQEYPVDPLDDAEAAALFTERARAVKPSFVPDEHVPEICRRLDNLPLALELAAARAKVLSPSTLLERLEQRLPLLTGGARDAPERQRTLRATIEWSHELLDSRERRLFARLAVFAGSFGLEAAEHVADGDLNTLERLIDNSLLRQTSEGRFFMLQTVHEFAFERLSESGELDRLVRCHASWMSDLAMAAEPELRGPRAKEWLGRLGAERANLRAAIQRAIERGEETCAAEIARGVWRFWYEQGDFREGRAWLEQVLQAPSLGDALRARLLNALGVIVLEQGDVDEAQLLQEESLELSRRAGDAAGAMYARGDLAICALAGGDLDRGIDLFTSLAEETADLGDGWAHAVTLLNLATAQSYRGDFDEAAQTFAASREEAAAIGNTFLVAGALCGGAQATLARGSVEAAEEEYAEAAIAALAAGALMTLAQTAYGLAAVRADDSPATAGRLYGCARAMFEELSVTPTAADAAVIEPWVDRARTAAPEEFEAGVAEGRAATPEELVSAVAAARPRP